MAHSLLWRSLALHESGSEFGAMGAMLCHPLACRPVSGTKLQRSAPRKKRSCENELIFATAELGRRVLGHRQRLAAAGQPGWHLRRLPQIRLLLPQPQQRGRGAVTRRRQPAALTSTTRQGRLARAQRRWRRSIWGGLHRRLQQRAATSPTMPGAAPRCHLSRRVAW